MGGKLSIDGYKSSSKDKYEPQLTIPSGRITMKDVPHNVYGIDNMGNHQMMRPNQEYRFPGSQVTEFPITNNWSDNGNQWNIPVGKSQVNLGYDHRGYTEGSWPYSAGVTIPIKQNGGLWNTNKNGYVDSVMNANSDKNFVQRYQNPNQYPVINNPDGSYSTHLMAYDKNRVYPTIVQDKSGKLINYGNNDNAWNYADTSGEYIDFPNTEQAKWFASSKDTTSGYKMGTQKKQLGGTKQLPVKYVSDPHDKRLQAYTDSLHAYQIQKEFQDGLSGPGAWAEATHTFTDKPQSSYIDDFVQSSILPKRTKLTPYGYDNLQILYGTHPNQIQQSSIALYKKPVQPVLYQPQIHPDQYADANNPGRTVIGNQTQGAPHHSPPTQDYLNMIRMQNRTKPTIQKLPISQPAQLSTDIPQQELQGIPSDYFNPQQDQWQSPNVVNGKLVQPAGFYKQQFGGNLNNNNMAKSKGFSIPGYKYGGNKLGGMAIIPDNNPWSASAEPVPVEYHRAMNGMMQMGGAYLDYMGLNPILDGMQYGGGTRNYDPVNQDNASISYTNDKRGYHAMQTPGQHYTNDGFKRSIGSTNNGASFSKYGGTPFQGFMPTPNEYAMLANGGHIDRYNTGGYSEYGGPMIYDQTPMQYGGSPDNDGDVDEMKHGGIHIKPENRGKFTAYKKRTGKTTEEALHSSDPHVRQMANFAKNAKHWAKKEFGGEVASKLSKFIRTYQDGGDVNNIPKAQWGLAPLPTDVSTGKQVAQNQVASAPNDDPHNTQLTTQMDDWSAQQNQQQAVSPKSPTNATPIDVNMDNGQYSPTADQPKQPGLTGWQKAGLYGRAANNLLGAGLMTTSFFEDQRNQRNNAGYQRQLGQSDNAFKSQEMMNSNSKGDYDQHGNFRPNMNTPVKPGIQYPMQQMGGYQGVYTGTTSRENALRQLECMQHGGQVHEMDLEPHEIQRLVEKGYKINYA